MLLFSPADRHIQEFLIEASHPSEELVRNVWQLLADDSGSGEPWDAGDVAAHYPGRASEIHVRSALAVLEEAGAVRPTAPNGGCHKYGVCASPARVEAASNGNLGVDFGALQVRADRERAKLQRMVLYCSGVQCRHHFLLHWFGDPDDAECKTACDQCVDSTGGHGEEASEEVTAERVLVVRKALSAAARLHGRFGVRRVAQVLTGSRERKLVAAGLDSLPTHGALSGWSQDAVVDLLHALVGVGCLRVVGAEYPMVELTSAGREVMHDRQTVVVPWPAGAPGSTATSRRGRRRKAASAPVGCDDASLYERLRELRLDLAREADVPAYHVAHDRSLRDVADHKPRTLGELEDCHGFGPRRVERYGEAFLTAVLAHLDAG